MPDIRERKHFHSECARDYYRDEEKAVSRARGSEDWPRPESYLSHSKPQVGEIATFAQFYKAIRALEKQIEAIVQEQRFRTLTYQWKSETRFMSNVTTKSIHEAYQKIIGMGQAAVPFILKDLQENGPNDWFWALYVITDVNPITEDIAGDMRAMTEVWLAWGKKAGYLNDYQPKMKNISRSL